MIIINFRLFHNFQKLLKMSTSGEKWETVSHKKKATVADKKAAQKAFGQHAPTVDHMCKKSLILVYL